MLPKLIALSTLLCCGLPAAVRLPSLLTDHMVVQRDLPVHVWGTASAGEVVEVKFRGATRSATADDVGMWSVYLPPGPAGGPFELSVSGGNTITLSDVMAGDVWVASGQSNMEFSLKDAVNGSAEVAGARHAGIRIFGVKQRSTQNPLLDVEADPWTVSTPESARNSSAVAYFFGRQLNQKLDVPVGLIEASWGGTPVESWMSLRTLTSAPDFMPAFALWSKTMDEFQVHQLRREKQIAAWEMAVTQAKAEGKQPPAYPWEPNLQNSWMPAGPYNAMIAPLTRFPIRGVIWYQGESNASTERVSLYAPMFQAMIRDWRRAWGSGDFPFLFVQLANFKTGPDNKWAELREAQLRTLSIARTGMAVAIDIGDAKDIHPKNKQEVGRRLALAAQAVAYGEPLEFSGPLYRTSAADGNGMRVWFDHASGLKTSGAELKGFEIAGADRRFVPASARIEENTVVVSSAAVAKPVFVRYGWADNPECTLYNGEGLPASPFRSAE